MQETVMQLLVWVTMTIGVSPLLPLPEVEHLPQAELNKMYIGSAGHGDLAGVYVHSNQTMYFPKGFTGKTKEDKATIVHELVHHVQNVLDTGVPPCFNEAEAYLIEDVWRAQNGLPIRTNTQGFVNLMGMCVIKESSKRMLK